MRTTWMAAAVLACAALVSPAFGQANDDAKAVLNESAKALKEVKGVQFNVKTYATGMLKEIIDLSGTVKIWRPDPAVAPTWRVDGRAKNPGKADRKLVVVSNGETVQWLDEEVNKLFERPSTDSEAMETVNLCRELILQEWSSSTPYQLEQTNFPILTKTGIKDIGGEVCDMVEAMPATKDRNRTWAISVKDRLPRQLELGTGQSAQKISKISDITDLKLVNLNKDDFVIKLPTGYTEDRQKAAPPIVPPPVAGGDKKPVAPVVVEHGPKTGTPAPAITAKDASGANVSTAALKGSVVVLEFWGTMFKPSTANVTEMKALATEFKGKATFIGVACRERDDKTAADWWNKSGPGYALIAKGDAIAKDYLVAGFPSYCVIDSTGNVSAFFQSFPGVEPLKTAITAAGK